ncbi:Tubulin-folding cofactor C [Camellia lanceoleosa]|uniref:Tubulin-folding cofactor C n=1 Tax=Camellia lanceoleosa TaxID=1840588 RepID=A0ACC0IX98_9ERIC|nr:Tubulin-folding cofactor C [Camellia lanceoleosa]
MEGEEDLSNPIKTLDPASSHPKHTAMLERLSNRKQPFLSRNPDSHPFESTNSFLSRFSQSKHFIDSDLTHCRQSTDPDSKSTLKSDLEAVSISISDLEKLVAENSYFLPSYEVRTCLQTISSLKQSLENVTSEVVPKKKFAFKSKKASSGVVDKTEIENHEIDLEKPSFIVPDLPGFRNMENEVLVKEFKGSEMGEFSISDLNSCEANLSCRETGNAYLFWHCRNLAGSPHLYIRPVNITAPTSSNHYLYHTNKSSSMLPPPPRYPIPSPPLGSPSTITCS